ncbi:MAG TPA: QsdR family transcriptional regulator [Thermoleophilaceae bacterium]|jgi:AcrR family transcriptional regulator
MSAAARATAPRRGRKAAASREDVIRAATRNYLRGQRVDVQGIAADLGLGRSTVYRWFGSREELIGEVLVRVTERLLDEARSEARGEGAAKLLDTFDRFNRALVAAPALRTFVDRERGAAVRIITSGTGMVQRRNVAMITEAIEDEVRAGRYDPPVDPATLGYAIVRLAEAFIFNESATGLSDSVDRLREVEAALLR